MREDWVAVCCGWPMGPGVDGSPYRSMQGRLRLVGLPSGGGGGLGAGVHRPRAWRGSDVAGLAGPRWRWAGREAGLQYLLLGTGMYTRMESLHGRVYRGSKELTLLEEQAHQPAYLFT